MPYGYHFASLNDCWFLLSLKLKVILLTSSVNTLCTSLLNLCCDLKIILLLCKHVYYVLCKFILYHTLSNETVNYDTKTKAYILTWTRSVSY